MKAKEQLQEIQGLMLFLASGAHGLEEILGRGAGGITFRAGKVTGKQAAVQTRAQGDLLEALDRVWEEMCRIGMRWPFEPYKRESDAQLIVEDDETLKMQLVFRHCMVRCSLFRYGHPQRLSLCMMNHGLFCGLLEKVHGKRANLEIIHAGENACLKLLTVYK